MQLRAVMEKVLAALLARRSAFASATALQSGFPVRLPPVRVYRESGLSASDVSVVAKCWAF